MARAAEYYEDETEAEHVARLEEEDEFDEFNPEFVNDLVDKLLVVTDQLSGHPLYPYQRPFSRRIIESVVIGDGATLTALFSRQSGKSETVANTIACLMIMLPVLAKVFPDLLAKFREGVWVGAFAPVDDQAETLHQRIVARLTSDRALELMSDPDINVKVKGKGREISLSNGSVVRRQTAHPRAIIEGKTYHIILMDECQGADPKMLNKSIAPMGASTNATMVYTGTPNYVKGAFYDQIQQNKRKATERGKRQDHFEADWRAAAAANSNYKKFVRKEMLRIGEDSDEFKLSYRLIWLLEQGMFTTQEAFAEMGDKSMEIVRAWHKTPVVVGIDPARKQDSTIVTVVYVDWDRPDEFGLFPHRVLNWLDLAGLDWETQYHRIAEFLANYNVYAVGIDTGGVGDAVASRLKVMLHHTTIVELSSARPDQSKRWKHLSQLMDRGLLTWPAHAKTRRLKMWKRFEQQMTDLQRVFTGPYMLAEAPEEAGAFDDYPDSLSMACVLTLDHSMPEIEVMDNIFYKRRNY